MAHNKTDREPASMVCCTTIWIYLVENQKNVAWPTHLTWPCHVLQ